MVSKKTVHSLVLEELNNYSYCFRGPSNVKIQKIEDVLLRFDKELGTLIHKKELPTASEARILALHGENSNDWKEYQRQMQIVEININHCIDVGETEFYLMDEVCNLASYKLICMGYQVGVKEVDPAFAGCKTKISW